MPYKYHNSNPNGYHIPDCVTRAISNATEIPYYEVLTMLHINGMICDCDDLHVRCYEKLLDKDLNLPHYIGNGNTAEEIASDFPNDILLLRMDGHLSMSRFGIIEDIWNCSDEIVTDFWVVS